MSRYDRIADHEPRYLGSAFVAAPRAGFDLHMDSAEFYPTLDELEAAFTPPEEIH